VMPCWWKAVGLIPQQEQSTGMFLQLTANAPFRIA